MDRYFTAAQNEKGVNTVYCSEYAADGIVCEEDWLEDHGWHLYTAVLTSTTCKIYIDGEVANSWTVSGSGDGNTICRNIHQRCRLEIHLIGRKPGMDMG